MKRLFIIRGLPGSGKSTLAHEITDHYYEADEYFCLNDSREYRFDPAKLSEAHAFCQKGVKNAMEDGIKRIAVSNTFVRRWEMQPYYEMAIQHKYEIIEITLSGLLRKNVHGVPDEVIERMRNNWEK